MRLSSFVSPREFGFVRAFFFALAPALLSAFCTQAQTKPIYQRDYIYDSQGRLINTVEPDTYGPFAPTGVSAAFDDTVCAVDVDWNATTDLGGSGVAKYWIYRNSTYVGQTTGLSFVDNYSIRGSYAYTVKGVDNAGNIGPASDPAYAIIQLCSPLAPTKKSPAKSSSLNPFTPPPPSRSFFARLGIPAFFRGVRNVTVAGFKKVAAFGGGL
jgi:hypothetical protein